MMNGFGVKETECTHCTHKEVCFYKQDFLEAQEAVDETYVSKPCSDGKTAEMIRIKDLKFIKPVLLHCVHYCKESKNVISYR